MLWNTMNGERKAAITVAAIENNSWINDGIRDHRTILNLFYVRSVQCLVRLPNALEPKSVLFSFILLLHRFASGWNTHRIHKLWWIVHFKNKPPEWLHPRHRNMFCQLTSQMISHFAHWHSSSSSSPLSILSSLLMSLLLLVPCAHLHFVHWICRRALANQLTLIVIHTSYVRMTIIFSLQSPTSEIHTEPYANTSQCIR